MKVNKIIFKIELTLLLIVLLISISFTFLSQMNYKDKLIEVNLVAPSEGYIDHEVEYKGNLNVESSGKYKVEWIMTDYINYIQNQTDPVEIEICNMKMIYMQDSMEKLNVTYQEGEMTEAFIDMTKAHEGGSKEISYLDQIPQTWKISDPLKVKIKIRGARKRFVLPSSCIIKDSQNSKSYVYSIDETPKIWGTEYSLRKILVNVIESNGELSAIDMYPGKQIVKDVITSYYDGMLVKYER